MSDSANRCKEGHVHKWPETGKMRVYPCERRCQYCTDKVKTYNQSSHLRAHVHEFHAKASGSHPGIQVQPGIMGRMAKFRDCPGTLPEGHQTTAMTPTVDRNAAKLHMQSEVNEPGSEDDTHDVRSFRFRFGPPGGANDFADHRASNGGFAVATPTPLEMNGASVFETPMTTGIGTPIDGYMFTPTTASMGQHTGGLADANVQYPYPYGPETDPSIFNTFLPANPNSDLGRDASLGVGDVGAPLGYHTMGDEGAQWGIGATTLAFNAAFAFELHHLMKAGEELGHSKEYLAALICEIVAAELVSV